MYNENGEYEVREEFGDEILITQRIKKRVPRVLTIMALSFHAAFEGLAIGLETDASDVWIMFAGTNLTMEFMWISPKCYRLETILLILVMIHYSITINSSNRNT